MTRARTPHPHTVLPNHAPSLSEPPICRKACWIFRGAIPRRPGLPRCACKDGRGGHYASVITSHSASPRSTSRHPEAQVVILNSFQDLHRHSALPNYAGPLRVKEPLVIAARAPRQARSTSFVSSPSPACQGRRLGQARGETPDQRRTLVCSGISAFSELSL